MKTTALVCTALVLAITFMLAALIKHANGKDLCHVEQVAPDWHYRTGIAPRPDIKCWYDGPRMKPRSELYWAEAPAVPAIPHLLWQQEHRWTDPSGWSHQE